jgi:SAM-dependent methyltransferase
VGYRVLAVDVSLDPAFGLGAAAPYVAVSDGQLSLALGDLEHPPLREAHWSLIVYSASLHYAGDLKAVLRRTARALQPNGWIAVLDAPIARRPVPGTGRGDRHIGRHELHQALQAAGLRPRWLSVRQDLRWWIYRLKAWLKGDAPFSFPMVVAQRVPSEQTS